MTDNLRLHSVFVGKRFTAYINYGDTEGLSAEDINNAQAFTQWVKDSAPTGYEFKRYCVEDAETLYKTHCEIDSRERCCVRVLVVYTKKGT